MASCLGLPETTSYVVWRAYLNAYKRATLHEGTDSDCILSASHLKTLSDPTHVRPPYAFRRHNDLSVSLGPYILNSDKTYPSISAVYSEKDKIGLG